MPSLNFFFSFARIFASHWYHANVMRQPNSKLKRIELNEENFAHRFEKTNKDLCELKLFKERITLKARKFYIRTNNNKDDSIETGSIVIAHLLPRKDLEKSVSTALS